MARLEGAYASFSGVVGAAVLVGVILTFLAYDNARTAWELFHVKEVYKAELVPARISGFDGIYMDRDMEASIGGVVQWIEDNIAEDDDIFFWRNHRFLYGAVGRSPPTGIMLYHEPLMTHNGLDPETEVIMQLNPKWIVLDPRNWEPSYFGTVMRNEAPQLAEWVESNFEVAADLKGFVVLKQSSQKLVNPVSTP